MYFLGGIMNNERPSNLEGARLQIARARLLEHGDLSRTMLTAAKISAATLGVDRVGIWSLSEDHSTLLPVVVHDSRDPAALPETAPLPMAAWPAYVKAILSRRLVAATDAQHDPRTSELAASYLVPRGVLSMLDVPLFMEGEVWGIVCHEHAACVREWTTREKDFAVSVADMLSGFLEQSRRLILEERVRSTEARLAKLQRADAMVRTASAIGHDINTVLQAISGSAERALREEAPELRQQALSTLLNDCRRAARVVDQLRELQRPSTAIGGGTDLSFVLRDTRPTLLALLEPSHRLEMDLAPHAAVRAGRTDVERILLNLVVNAKEAMPEGGVVQVRVHAEPSSVALEVRDQGKGLPPDQASRVFEPYFTTKSGRSVGLGLFAVDTLARTTGGTAAFVTHPGKGTTVSVTWPRDES